MKLFRRIWALYAVALFLIMMTASLIYLLLNILFLPSEKALRRNIQFLHHSFTPVFLTLIGVRVKVHGLEKIDPQTAYVIVSNHQSSLDFITNAQAFPGIFRFLAKKELLKIPVFGWVVGKMCLIVDRTSAFSRSRSVAELKENLRQGWSVFIYPEGGRNRTKETLAPFYDGAFRIAIETGAPIAIQTIVNIADIAPEALASDLKPGTLHIVWDHPIPTHQLTTNDISQLRSHVRERMTFLIDNFKLSPDAI